MVRRRVLLNVAAMVVQVYGWKKNSFEGENNELVTHTW
jgi:hypothetical protein